MLLLILYRLRKASYKRTRKKSPSIQRALLKTKRKMAKKVTLEVQIQSPTLPTLKVVREAGLTLREVGRNPVNLVRKKKTMNQLISRYDLIKTLQYYLIVEEGISHPTNY